MEQEVGHGATEVYAEFKLEAVRLIKDRGVSYVQASEDLGVHTSQLRDWVKKLFWRIVIELAGRPDVGPAPTVAGFLCSGDSGRPGFHKIAAQFGVRTGTVQRIAGASRPDIDVCPERWWVRFRCIQEQGPRQKALVMARAERECAAGVCSKRPPSKRWSGAFSGSLRARRAKNGLGRQDVALQI
jgi:hypothetical protein